MRKTNVIDSKDQVYDKEDAVVFLPTDKVPLNVQMVGITYPFSNYCVDRVEDIFVFEYIIEGEGVVEIDGEWRRAAAGDTYFVFPGRQRYHVSATNPWKKIWINFTDCSYMKDMLASFGLGEGVYHVNTLDQFEQLYRLARAGDNYAEFCYSVAEIIHQIVMRVSFAQREQPTRLSEIQDALNSAIRRHVSLEQIAEELHLSQSQLIRTFRTAFGVTPYEYLLDAKIKTAKMLLRHSKLSVKEISAEVGMQDEHYFSNLFTKRVGCRPRVFRKDEHRE